ncbi:MAG: phosphoglycerate dehydrogenase [Acidobacteriota bacterium]|nr:phosphoglycerate dehydrogenase [Acidobacteriota bacterium]
MKKVVVSDPLGESGLEFLRAADGIDVDVAVKLPLEELMERLKGADALIVRSGTKVTAELIDAADRLSVIGRAGIGVDNIDVEAATERGIVVLNTPDANATTTAELTVAHLLSLSRHLPHADRSVRDGDWKRSKYVGREVAGKTIGIVGFGTIGRIVASRCLGLQMRVLAHDPFVTKEIFEGAGVEPTELEKLLSASDYVTVHCPLNDKTRGIIDAEKIGLMKKGAFLLNCARGGIVEEGALYDALVSGQLGGAALDVYESEPPAGSPLLELDNVVLTPHLGASTREAQDKVATAIGRQVAAFLTTGEAINAINLPPVASEELARLRPYQILAQKLGRMLAHLAAGPLERVEVALYGRAAQLESHPVAVEALVGLLQERMGESVNRVNASRIARRQGIMLVESRSEEVHDFVSLVTVTGRHEDRKVEVAGTLLAERHPRLVRIDDFEIEAIPEGVLLVTRHNDRPGVIGALGTLLGQRDVNISRMHLGLRDEGEAAMAILAISRPLDQDELSGVGLIPAIREVVQVIL